MSSKSVETSDAMIDHAAGPAGLVAQKIARNTGAVFAPDVIAELLQFDPAFEPFVDRLEQKPPPTLATEVVDETPIERARRILDELESQGLMGVEHSGM